MDSNQSITTTLAGLPPLTTHHSTSSRNQEWALGDECLRDWDCERTYIYISRKRERVAWVELLGDKSLTQTLRLSEHRELRREKSKNIEVRKLDLEDSRWATAQMRRMSNPKPQCHLVECFGITLHI